MIRAIDHLVIACADPDVAAAELGAGLGLEATGGGRHERFGTRNRIVWLADGSYLELIGMDDPSPRDVSPVTSAVRRTLDHSAGLATYALLADELTPTVATLASTGSSVGAVQHGTRRREDGELVEWWAAFPATDLAPDATPFLIEHASTGAEWGPAALAERARQPHPIGSPVRLVGLDIATDDPLAAAATLHAELGLDLRAVADLAVADIGPHVLRFRPRREMPVPAVVRLSAAIASPTTVQLLGVRFDVARADLPLPVGAEGR
jgi:Glyoxalase-like domain